MLWNHPHDILAALGMLPALGIVPDLLDALWYLAEGHGGEAAFSLAAAVPVVGDLGRLGKYGAKAIDAAEGVGHGLMRGEELAAKSVRHGPMNPGPLAEDIANTFRSGTYTARTLNKPTTLYRVIGDTGNPAGSYWTRVKPQGSLQSVIDSALDQNWGNTASRVVEARIPAGTRIYEGAASAQRGLVGGGNQIYIPEVDPKWIIP